MNNVVSGKDAVCKEITDALGIKHCRKLILKMVANSVVTVEAEFFPEKDGLKQLSAILRKYKLIETI